MYTINGFSAHADQKELLEWLSSFGSKPEVFIVHGEENVALDFEKLVQERLGLKTHVPHKGDELTSDNTITRKEVVMIHGQSAGFLQRSRLLRGP